MKVQTLQNFTDMKENVLREQGEIFEVTKERYDEINAHAFGPLIKIIEEKKEKNNG